MTDSSHTTTTPEDIALRGRASAPARVPSKPKRISPAKQRKLVETAIERLVDLLDAIDPDADDEPSLGWPTQHEIFPQDTTLGHHHGDDREGTGWRYYTDDHEPDDDSEPGLGWQNQGSQEYLTISWTDCEDEHDGLEPEGL